MPGTRPKSLMLLPERYRIRCVDELGLIARAVIVWHKPNGLPESVTDRVCRSHEDWVHLTKRPRYYSAIDEVRLPADAARGASRAPTCRPALGPELSATLHTDDSPAPVRGWLHVGPLQDAIRAAVAADAQRLKILHPVGFNMRVETSKRNYVVDLDSVRRPALDASSAVTVHHALTQLYPAGTTPALVSTRPAGILLADVILNDTAGRAEVLDFQVTLIAPEGLAARVTVNLYPGRATLLIWDALAAHHAILPPRSAPLGSLPGSVWELPTQPLNVPPELGIDHFAAFPMALPRRLIIGWCPREVCTACDEGRRPLVDKELVVGHMMRNNRHGFIDLAEPTGNVRGMNAPARAVGSTRATITGYSCACPDTTAPTTAGVVLDPFGGTSTTSLVATMLGRVGISVELSADYCRLARWRAGDPKERARAAGLDPEVVAAIKAPPADQLDLFGEVS